MIQNIILNLLKIIAAVSIFALAACETPNATATADTMSVIDAANNKAAAAEAAAIDAKRAAERSQAMSDQNQSALRALNDKIDRMFRTMSRK